MYLPKHKKVQGIEQAPLHPSLLIFYCEFRSDRIVSRDFICWSKFYVTIAWQQANEPTNAKGVNLEPKIEGCKM